MTRFCLIGGGGHARSLLQMLPPDVACAGYTDIAPVEQMPIPYLGTDSELLAGPLHIAVALTGIDSLDARRRIIDRLASATFVTLTAPTAILAPGSEIGPGAAVMHGAIINGAKIGPHTIINSGAIVEHEVSVGENCFIGPGAIICGGVTIGHDVIIGAGACVRNGVSIPSGTIVGMGAVVTHTITTPGVYTGNPAQAK